MLSKNGQQPNRLSLSPFSSSCKRCTTCQEDDQPNVVVNNVVVDDNRTIGRPVTSVGKRFSVALA